MYDKMLNSDIMNMTKHCAKHCALIAVYEILNIGCIEVPYWQQVKQEIEKL
jgi:hypothetical protein